jgi:GNAT superfamily N-acetyltransferase
VPEEPARRAVVRAGAEADRDWVVDAARRLLGSEHQVHSRRQFHVDAHELLIADLDGEPAGFLAWIVDGDDCEVLAIASDRPRTGIGSALLDGIDQIARDHGCRRLHLTTTDANVGAQRFYEARGWTLAERLVGAVDRCREQWKPEIPAHMHDELVYERHLST